MTVYDGATTRRELLALSAGAASLVIVNTSATLAAPSSVASRIAEITGGKPVAEGRIKLDLPSIAENGLSVPATFEVESPMTERDFVKAVYLLAEENPAPDVATYHFTPMMPKASATIRIRLARSQSVIAIAEMSDGSFHRTRKAVTVTVGGCGG